MDRLEELANGTVDAEDSTAPGEEVWHLPLSNVAPMIGSRRLTGQKCASGCSVALHTASRRASSLGQVWHASSRAGVHALPTPELPFILSQLPRRGFSLWSSFRLSLRGLFPSLEIMSAELLTRLRTAVRCHCCRCCSLRRQLGTPAGPPMASPPPSTRTPTPPATPTSSWWCTTASSPTTRLSRTSWYGNPPPSPERVRATHAHVHLHPTATAVVCGSASACAHLPCLVLVDCSRLSIFDQMCMKVPSAGVKCCSTSRGS